MRPCPLPNCSVPPCSKQVIKNSFYIFFILLKIPSCSIWTSNDGYIATSSPGLFHPFLREKPWGRGWAILLSFPCKALWWSGSGLRDWFRVPFLKNSACRYCWDFNGFQKLKKDFRVGNSGSTFSAWAHLLPGNILLIRWLVFSLKLVSATSSVAFPKSTASSLPSDI